MKRADVVAHSPAGATVCVVHLLSVNDLQTPSGPALHIAAQAASTPPPSMALSWVVRFLPFIHSVNTSQLCPAALVFLHDLCRQREFDSMGVTATDRGPQSLDVGTLSKRLGMTQAKEIKEP